MIDIDLNLNSALDWKDAIERAEAEKVNQQGVRWRIKMNFEYPFKHPLQFASLVRGFQAFQDDVLERFKVETKEICLYDGNLFDERLKNSEFLDWCESQKIEPDADDHPWLHPFAYRSFLAEFLNLFALNCPHSLPLSVRLQQPTAVGFFMKAMVLQKGPFSRFKVFVSALLGSVGASTGLLLPPLGWCKPKAIRQAEVLFAKQSINPKQIRLIPEEDLTQLWQGLDTLYIFSEILSREGRRRVKGFEAAGGSVVEL